LSYTNFEYSDLQLSRTEMTPEDKLVVSFTLTNKGRYPGEEVAQLYIRDLVAQPVRPVKELKDFSKIRLEPGESRRVSFTIDKNKLAFYNQQLEWITQPGQFELMIGTASNDIRLHSTFTLK
jgi:beta-glucosidase